MSERTSSWRSGLCSLSCCFFLHLYLSREKPDIPPTPQGLQMTSSFWSLEWPTTAGIPSGQLITGLICRIEWSLAPELACFNEAKVAGSHLCPWTLESKVAAATVIKTQVMGRKVWWQICPFVFWLVLGPWKHSFMNWPQYLDYTNNYIKITKENIRKLLEVIHVIDRQFTRWNANYR